MDQAVQEQTSFLESVDLEQISGEAEVPIWEIEYAVYGTLKGKCELKTIPELYNLYESSKIFSRARFEAKVRLNILCLKAVEEASTFCVVFAVFKFTTHESSAYQTALSKMLDLARTETELKCLISRCPDIINETRIRAIRKIIELNTI